MRSVVVDRGFPLAPADLRSVPFSDADLQQLEQRGVAVEEARRQLQCFVTGFAPARLDRAATVGDGIETLDSFGRDRALEAWQEAAHAGRLAKFVPASGAASRMFRDLLAALGEDDGAPLNDATRRVLDHADDFAFSELWREAVRARGLSWPPTGRPELSALLTADGLGMANWPKGRIPFHRYADGTRSAFVEQLHEATRLCADSTGRCRIHFTVTAAAREDIRRELETVRVDGCEFDWSDSLQDPSTDTLAANPDGSPFRDAEGRLVFRAGGHGALIRNLEDYARESGSDVLMLKNIDNVAREELELEQLATRRALVGSLLLLRQEARRHWEKLHAPADADAVANAEHFCRERLHRSPTASTPAAICEVLDRPTRVCGMVRNEGEPGGGPFWVRDDQGRVSLQIVEGSQIDQGDAAQAAILAAATHFNPVDLVCAVRSFASGEAYPLADYVDPETGFISRKSFEGRDLQALERPGLWNGAMAGWNTVFVEVPVETFHPVKTVLDLLRPAHQDPRARG